MRNFYFQYQRYRRTLHPFLLVVLFLGSLSGYAQVRKPFTPRTSQFSPNKQIYNIKGDFTMIGNTNMSTTTNL